jgi:hypothetical protein
LTWAMGQNLATLALKVFPFFSMRVYVCTYLCRYLAISQTSSGH